MVTFLVAILVLFSLSLVIYVPVVLGSPGQWKTYKYPFSKGILIWVVLVIAVAIADGKFPSAV